MPRATALQLHVVTPWITAAALAHGADLPAHLMARLGLARRAASALLARLVAAQWLQRSGSTRRPAYAPGALRQVVQRYALAGLEEDLPWRRDFAPFFVLPPNVQRMAQHAFTELLNNAVDHSGGRQVTVSVRQTPLHLQLLVSDDGCGLFRRIAQAFALDEPALAMFELSKGKLTSLPERHSGRGLFFCSRLADIFDIHTHQAAFQYRPWAGTAWKAARPAAAGGTSVYLALALDSERTLDQVLHAHSADGTGYGFQRTRVPLQLLAAGGALASRADARRVAARLDQFTAAELDFSGLDDVGHGFADELFRVYRRDHPGVRLHAVGMNPRVSAMVGSIGA